jgi:hypothetical protein
MGKGGAGPSLRGEGPFQGGQHSEQVTDGFRSCCNFSRTSCGLGSNRGQESRVVRQTPDALAALILGAAPEAGRWEGCRL